MKTRDELAEAFAVAMVGKTVDPLREWADIATDAFALSDAFVRERERRAVAPSSEGATGRVFVKCLCGKPATHRDHDDRTGRASEQCCGDLARCCILDSKDWTRAPLAPEKPVVSAPFVQTEDLGGGLTMTVTQTFPLPETPAPKALRFSASGTLLNDGGDVADVTRGDDHEGFVYWNEAAIRFRAASREHAERIIAAVLPVGRAVKP